MTANWQEGNKQGSFTYEDYLALSDAEKQRIDAEVDAMPVEELQALGSKVADFIFWSDVFEKTIAGFEGD